MYKSEWRVNHHQTAIALNLYSCHTLCKFVYCILIYIKYYIPSLKLHASFCPFIFHRFNIKVILIVL